jgi:hypothetical protein
LAQLLLTPGGAPSSAKTPFCHLNAAGDEAITPSVEADTGGIRCGRIRSAGDHPPVVYYLFKARNGAVGTAECADIDELVPMELVAVVVLSLVLHGDVNWIANAANNVIAASRFRISCCLLCVRAGARGPVQSNPLRRNRWEGTAERDHSTPKAAGVNANYCGEGVNAASDGAFAKI